MNYSEKLRRLRERRNHDFKLYSVEKTFSEEPYRLEIDAIQEYVVDAMKELPRRSTEISYEEGDRVKNHLMKELPNYGFNPDFQYQGSSSMQYTYKIL